MPNRMPPALCVRGFDRARGGPLLSALACTLLLAGCASGGAAVQRAPVQTVQVQGMAGRLTINANNTASMTTISAPVDLAWRALPGIMDSIALPVSTVNQAQRVIGNEGLKIRQRLGKTSLSRYIDCGQTQIGPNADSYDVFLIVLVQLQAAAGGGTSVTTTVDASARPIAFTQAASTCSSKGTLESRILALLQTATAQR
jgi:hypothetical protein